MLFQASILLLASASSLLVNAAPTNRGGNLALSKRSQPAPDDGVEITALTMPDGTRKMAFWENGVLEGYLIENPDNSSMPFTMTDAFGAPIDPAAAGLLDDEAEDGQDGNDWGNADEEADIERRGILGPIVSLASRFKPIFKKWGKRAWDFCYCAGIKQVYSCRESFLSCATQGKAPWKCEEGLVCLAAQGRHARHC